MPAWLDSLQEVTPATFPLREVLNGSVYYPASGTDGRLVQLLHSEAHSSVNVDYSQTRSQVLDEMQKGFSGYRLLGFCDLTKSNLVPTGWPPYRLPHQVDPEPFFCVWAVFERIPTDSANYNGRGPERFSLVHLCEDGVATYNALYGSNRCVAGWVAIIYPNSGTRPGTNNWTNFFDENEPLAQVVTNNPAGRPTYLLCHTVKQQLNPPRPEWSTYYPVFVSSHYVEGIYITKWTNRPNESSH